MISAAVPYGRVVRIEELVGPLGTAIGRPVKVSKALSRHCVLVTQAPDAEAALKAVAKAVSASLVEDGQGGLELRRTDEESKAIREARADARQAWLGNFLKGAAEYRQSAASKPIDRAIEDAIDAEATAWIELAKHQRTSVPPFRVANLLPAETMLEGLIARVGIRRIASIPSGEVEVFEDAPVQTAEALPEHRDLTDAYVESTDRYAAFGVKALIGKRAQGSQMMRPVALPPDNGRNIVRWRLQCTAEDRSIGFLLQGYDREGKRLEQAELMAMPNDGDRSASAYVTSAKTDPNAVWLSLSEESKRAATIEGGGGATPPSWYLDPLAREPLDTFVRDALVSVAHLDRSPCVAFDVPDRLWSTVRCCLDGGRISVAALRRVLGDPTVYVHVSRPESEVWSSPDVEGDELRQADRKALSTFAKSYGGDVVGQLRAAGKLYYGASPRPGAMADLWWQLSQQFDPSRPTNPMLDRECYALIGAIPDALWPRAARGETMRSDQLGVTEETKRYLACLPESAVEGGSLRDVERHASELFPTGQFGGATITLKPFVSSVIRAWPDGSPEGQFWSSTNLIAEFLRIPPSSANGGSIASLRETCEAKMAKYSFRQGTESRVEFTLGLPRNGDVHQTGPRTTKAEPNSFRYADLPSSVRDRYWANAIQQGLAAAQKRP